MAGWPGADRRPRHRASGPAALEPLVLVLFPAPAMVPCCGRSSLGQDPGRARGFLPVPYSAAIQSGPGSVIGPWQQPAAKLSASLPQSRFRGVPLRPTRAMAPRVSCQAALGRRRQLSPQPGWILPRITQSRGDDLPGHRKNDGRNPPTSGCTSWRTPLAFVRLVEPAPPANPFSGSDGWRSGSCPGHRGRHVALEPAPAAAWAVSKCRIMPMTTHNRALPQVRSLRANPVAPQEPHRRFRGRFTCDKTATRSL